MVGEGFLPTGAILRISGPASASARISCIPLGLTSPQRALRVRADGTDDDRGRPETQKINQTSQQTSESHLMAPNKRGKLGSTKLFLGN